MRGTKSQPRRSKIANTSSVAPCETFKPNVVIRPLQGEEVCDVSIETWALVVALVGVGVAVITMTLTLVAVVVAIVALKR